MKKPLTQEEAKQRRLERELETSLSNSYPGISRYGPPEPRNLSGLRVKRKPRLDELDEERQY